MSVKQIVDVPADVLAALATNASAADRFAAMPPSHKAQYVKWIEEAKKPETRSRRVSGMLEKLG